MEKKKIIVSVSNDLLTDQRVYKTCNFLYNKGFEVVLVGRKISTGKASLDRPYKTRRFKLFFNKGAAFYAELNIRLFFYLLFHRSDLLLANDLDTLPANALVKKLTTRKLIYDSHEYFTEVPEIINRPRVQKIWKNLEEWCIPSVDKFYTVNKSLADFFKKKYQREVYVVKNVPLLKELPKEKSRRELGLPEDKKILILQGAGINIDRGTEELVEAMKLLSDDYLLLIIGGGDVLSQVKSQIKTGQLENKVVVKDKMPYQELMQYTMNADAGVTIDKDTNINYRYSLPNKLFDYVHAHIPVIASDLIEVRKVVTSYKVGEIIPDHQPASIAKAIKSLFENRNHYDRLRKNTFFAVTELNWQKEEETLREIFDY